MMTLKNMDKQFNPLQSSAPADEDASQTALRNRLIAKIKEHIVDILPSLKRGDSYRSLGRSSAGSSC
ncbi:MAG: hypothetical protein MR571_04115, partial [Succinatimonas sp.]|nr:hypothetical protein [Succinatimonas sp.]